MTPFRAASATCGETPSRIATCLNEASHSLNPSALSPQSAARADATPIVAAATTANIDRFQTSSHSALQFIVVDSESC